MSRFNINLHETIYSLSDALDLVGVNHVHHGKRVAFMAAECAKALQWDTPQLDSLFKAAILHDCGVSTTTVHKKLTQLEWEFEKKHCQLGAMLLRETPLLANLADIVLHHHTHWEDLQKQDIPLSIKMQANCIYLVDRVDMLCIRYMHEEENILLHKEKIRAKISEKKHSWFSPELVDSFLHISNSDFFWFSLENEHISGYVSTWVGHDCTQEIEFADLQSIVRIFSYIVDTKSAYTQEHSEGVACLARYLGELNQLSEARCDMLEIAGLLHDVGKLRVPDEILEKPAKLSVSEYALMKRHSFDSYDILSKIKGFEEIAQWAGDHHECLNGAGYPSLKNNRSLSLEARIISVADIFQALAQKRPYRGMLSAQSILAILKQEVAAGKLAADIVNKVEENLDTCMQKALHATNLGVNTGEWLGEGCIKKKKRSRNEIGREEKNDYKGEILLVYQTSLTKEKAIKGQYYEKSENIWRLNGLS